MNEAQYKKQLLLQQIDSNRELARLELDGLRHRVGGVVQVFDIGKQLIQPLGAIAGGAAASVARKPGKAGGVVGLAALIPIVLTVAKLVASFSKRSGGDEVERSAGVETEVDQSTD